MVYRAASLVVMATVVLRAIALAPAAGAEGAQSSVMFASSDDLMHCLAVRWSVDGGDAPLFVADCPLARQNASQDFGVEWERVGLAGAQTLAALSLRRPSAAASLGPRLCLAPGSPPTASEAACTAGHLWHWDEHQRLTVTAVGAQDASDRLCLERGEEGSVATVPCTVTRRQKWLALGRGAADPNARLDEVQFPLRAHGRRVVDAKGRIVRLRGVNWYGAHMEQKVNNGLDKKPIAHIAKLIRHLGFNHVRLNYAVAMWAHRNEAEPISGPLLSANPELHGKTDLEVFDAVVEGLTAEGLLVIINAHTSDHRWCCSFRDDNGLWYNDRYSEQDWLDSLEGLAARYANNPHVIGFDIRNEPRPTMPQGSKAPTAIWWDTEAWGNCTEVSLNSYGKPIATLGSFSSKGICLPQFFADWRAAATEATYAVLHGNPDSLVFIEGVGAAELLVSERRPMPLKQGGLKNRIVWSVHDYTWTWRWYRLGDFMANGRGSFEEVFKSLSGIYNNGATDLRVEDFDTFREDRIKAWAFMLKDNVAPVWVGEFGENRRSEWWKMHLKWAAEMDLDWCYWAIDGYKYPPGVTVDTSVLLPDQAWGIPNGKPTTEHLDEPFGLLDMNYTGAKMTWKLADLLSIQAPVLGSDAEAVKLPEDTKFDAALQPVGSTGPHPAGLNGFLDFDAPTKCGPGAPRRLEDAVEVQPASEMDVQGLAELAHEHMHRSCRATRGPGMSDKERARARDTIQRNEQQGSNPVQEALRSKKPEEAQAAFQRILDAKMGNIQRFFSGFFAILGCTSVLAMLLHMAGRSRSGCRRCRPWSPPIGLAAAMSRNRAFRPLLAACYVVLAGGIIGTAAWGLSAIVRSKRGVATTECAAMRGVDGALNGDGAAFVGVLPALAHIETLTTAIAKDSPHWRSTGGLMENLDAVPPAVVSLRTALGALAANSDADTCAGIDREAVAGASAKVEWSLAAAVNFAVPSVDMLEPRAAKLLAEARVQLKSARANVQQVRDFVVQEFRFFYKNDPMAWASNAAQTALLALMVIFFALVIPTLLFSTMAAVLFVFNDKLPVLPQRCSDKLPKRCCRRAGPRFVAQRSMQLVVKSKTIRPHAACIVWTSGLLFGVIAIGMSVFLRRSTEMGVSVCSVLGNLNSETIEEYAPAFGISVANDTALARATKAMILGCLGTGPDPFGGSLVEVATCPADKLPSRFGEVIENIEAETRKAFDEVSRGAVQSGIMSDAHVQTLIRGLESMGNGTRTGKGCAATHSWEQLASLRRAGQEICADGSEEECAVFAGNMSGVDVKDQTAQAASALAAILRRRASHVDGLVLNVTDTVGTHLYKFLEEDVTPHVVALADSLDCRFLGRAVQDAVDGICFEVLVGLIQLRYALFVLGILSLAMSVVMYHLWWRLKACQAISKEHFEASRRAASGGNAANLSGFSRNLARGMCQGQAASVLSSPTTRSASEATSPLAAAMVDMEEGATTPPEASATSTPPSTAPELHGENTEFRGQAAHKAPEPR